MLIHIRDLDGVERDVDDAVLVKTDGIVDDDNEHTTWVEYRRPESDVIVHRSCHVTMKHWPAGLAGTAQPLG